MTLIQSRDNAFFKQLKKLAESGRERRKQGLTLLDGAHLVRAYEAAIGPVERLVVAETALAQMDQLLLQAGNGADAAAAEELRLDRVGGERALGDVDGQPAILGLAVGQRGKP